MVKYSIVINHIQNDLYALVINTYELNAESVRINEQSNVETGLTFEQVQNKIAAL